MMNRLKSQPHSHRIVAYVLGLLTASVLLNASAKADVQEVRERAKAFNQYLGADAENYLDIPVKKKITGIRNLKTVLPGALYRSGGPGGETPLKAEAIQGLCEAGFSKAFYLYPQGFQGSQTITCKGPNGKDNTFTYVQKDYLTPENKQAILNDIYYRIQDGSVGPALVHCWNGFHASGEIAAVSLMQFCGMSSVDAKDYWMRNQKGAQMISRIGKFRDFSEIRLSSDLQDAVCPR